MNKIKWDEIMVKFYNNYKYILVPFLLWLLIQISKVVVDCIQNKRFSLSRLLGSGGMPSSHSAVMVSITVMLGKYIEIGRASCRERV